MPAINQETGETDKLGPLEILRQYRGNRVPGAPEKAMFGQLGLALQTSKKIKLGDMVTVLDRKK